jgi:hypothetical protein
MARTSSLRLQPLDQVALSAMGVLLLISVLLLGLGDRSRPRVQSFTWQQQDLAAGSRALIFSFTRPMDRSSVEQGFQLQPDLPGKFSWAGRRMAYTLDLPLPFGTQFKVKIQDAQSRLGHNRQLPLFQAQFQTPDRAFAYIGSKGSEDGRLVLYNLTQRRQTILTPANLQVLDFQPFPQRDRLIFSAVPRTPVTDFLQANLYTVTTGLPSQGGGDKAQPAGKVTPLLDSRDYQNLRFEVTPEGQRVLVQRSSRLNPAADYGLWSVGLDGRAERLPIQPGGDFRITPDGRSLVLAQGQGVSLLSLDGSSQPPQFLPRYGQVLGFSPDGTQAAFVRFHSDYTQSLDRVPSQGSPQQLWRNVGSIRSASFDPSGQTLYAVIGERSSRESEQENLSIVQFDLRQQPARPEQLLLLPGQREINVSLAPDGLGLLLDQPDLARDNSHLWLLPLVPPTLQRADQLLPPPEALPLNGTQPKWIP